MSKDNPERFTAELATENITDLPVTVMGVALVLSLTLENNLESY